jgi:hypothetical protein
VKIVRHVAKESVVLENANILCLIKVLISVVEVQSVIRMNAMIGGVIREIVAIMLVPALQIVGRNYK